ncbi:2,3,4,5-tetrahydropyridine-2,6-dicarboxylate N-acetyltransferase [Vibrio stylophorae]|uniref:2,3,4,5-tetrahydropyridine-2,6-dicarboxylate N-acetyltransferase n=1 Tax=Vibrio stylophorae TaxID=659351 RepID=A0ABM8ZQN6_9VIBR|nr:acyltransferase [Vibrio stylophorae]CAH0532387.1 2,3,4,5-tetrahydropyridine-2,6-dicarboxylate N-acetyltransferase [Vibrio stylophorae]
MACVYENLYPLGADFIQRYGEDRQRWIVGEQQCSWFGQAHVGFTLVRDAEDYVTACQRVEIDADDFQHCISLGQNTVIYSENNLAFENLPVRLTCVKVNQHPAGRIQIGEHVMLQGTNIVCYQQVSIGDHSMFGPRVTIMDSSGHPLLNRGDASEAERTKSAPIEIGKHVWVGMGATILKGVTIGDHAVIGANSVVYHDVPAGAIVVGNPAKIVKQLPLDESAQPLHEAPHGMHLSAVTRELESCA